MSDRACTVCDGLVLGQEEFPDWLRQASRISSETLHARREACEYVVALQTRDALLDLLKAVENLGYSIDAK